MIVCKECGVEVAESRSGRLVHTDELPRGVDPDHEILAVQVEEWAVKTVGIEAIKAAATDMLVHHATLHPAAECPWYERLAESLRS